MEKDNFFEKRMKKLDIFEQVILLIFYIWFISRLWPNSFATIKLDVLLILLSESLVVILLIIRRPTENISNRFWDWLIAFSGSFLPLLIVKGGTPLMPNVGVCLLLFGLYTHAGAKLSLFRSFGIVPANRGIKVRGLYAIVRHPMYAGYFCTHMGFLLVHPSMWNLVIYTCTWFFLLLRIFAEESILLRSPDYKKYTERVRYRIIPGIF